MGIFPQYIKKIKRTMKKKENIEARLNFAVDRKNKLNTEYLPLVTWYEIAKRELCKDWGVIVDKRPEATIYDCIVEEEPYDDIDWGLQCLEAVARAIVICCKTEGQVGGDGIAVAWRFGDGVRTMFVEE